MKNKLLKKKIYVLMAVMVASLLGACGGKDVSREDPEEQEEQQEPSEAEEDGFPDGEQSGTEENKPTEEDTDTTQDLEEIYVGAYADYDNGEPNLFITKGEDGKYDVKIGIFRLASMDDGVGELTENGMTFRATDPAGNPISGVITVKNGVAKVIFTDSTWVYLENGTTYEYTKITETQNAGSGDETFADISHPIQIDFVWTYDSATNPYLWAVEYEYPVFDSEQYPELSMAIQDYRMNYVRNIEAARDDLKALAEHDYYEYGADSWMGYYYFVENMKVKRADEIAVSIVEQGYMYQGGAHGSEGFGCFNVDSRTGDRITLDDVIVKMDLLPEIIATEMLELYPDITYWTPTLEETIEAYITPEITLTWTLEYNGVTFYFGSYEIGSYADGLQQVTVLYSEYQPIFNAYYFENVAEDYIIPANAGGTINADIDADRESDHITVEENYTGADGGFTSFTIRMGEQEYTQDAYGWAAEPYYVRLKGKSYVYVTVSTEDISGETYVYEITGSSIVYKGAFTGYVK